MNITLRDLLRWSETPLTMAREAILIHPDRPISWPVTMRATPPILPQMEPGAIVLLAGTILAEVRPYLPGALHELRRRGVGALVIDPGESLEFVADDLDLLAARGGVTPDLELLLTRLINERRSRLYRRGTEIDRALTEATLLGRSVVDLLRIGVTQLGRPLLLLDERGRVQESALPSGQATLPRPPAPPQGVDQALVPFPDPIQGIEWLMVPLDGTAQGWLALSGPRGGLDEVDRLLVTRVAAACALALAQTRRESSRLAPARRAALVADLLDSRLAAEERINRAELLGMESGARFALLALQPQSNNSNASRVVANARQMIAARAAPYAEFDGFVAESTGAICFLFHTNRTGNLGRLAQALRIGFAQVAAKDADNPDFWAVLSESVADLEQLPGLARQVGYGLAVLRSGGADRTFADWSTLDDLGPYTLLYPVWGTPAAATYVAEMLGDLPEHDLRYGGELLPTLLTYLRQGGAAGAAAAALAIHRNTLTYRLRRIEEICQRSPLEPTQQLAMHLAAILATLPFPED